MLRAWCTYIYIYTVYIVCVHAQCLPQEAFTLSPVEQQDKNDIRARCLPYRSKTNSYFCSSRACPTPTRPAMCGDFSEHLLYCTAVGRTHLRASPQLSTSACIRPLTRHLCAAVDRHRFPGRPGPILHNANLIQPRPHINTDRKHLLGNDDLSL